MRRRALAGGYNRSNRRRPREAANACERSAERTKNRRAAAVAAALRGVHGSHSVTAQRPTYAMTFLPAPVAFTRTVLAPWVKCQQQWVELARSNSKPRSANAFV